MCIDLDDEFKRESNEMKDSLAFLGNRGMTVELGLNNLDDLNISVYGGDKTFISCFHSFVELSAFVEGFRYLEGLRAKTYGITPKKQKKEETSKKLMAGG